MDDNNSTSLLVGVRIDVWEWLVQLGIFSSSQLSKADASRVYLDRSAQLRLESGEAFLHLLQTLLASNEKDRLVSSLSSFTSTSSPATRLGLKPAALRASNWNSVAKLLTRFDISLDDDMKMLIVAGDTDIIVATLENVFSNYQRFPLTNKGQSTHTGASSIAELKVWREDDTSLPQSDSTPTATVVARYERTSSRLECKDDSKQWNASSSVFSESGGEYEPALSRIVRLLLESMTKYLPDKIIPTSESLLSSSGHSPAAAQLLLYGFRSSFELVMQWLQASERQAHALAECIIDQSSGDILLLVFSFFSPGLRSREGAVATQTCKVLQSIVKLLPISSSWALSDALWMWLSVPLSRVGDLSNDELPNDVTSKLPTSGLNAIFICYRQHATPDHRALVLSFLCECVSLSHWKKFFSKLLFSLFLHPADYASFVQQILSGLISQPVVLNSNSVMTMHEVLVKEKIVDFLFELAIRGAQSTDAHTLTAVEQERQIGSFVALLGELCVLFPDHLATQDGETAKLALDFLRDTCRNNSQSRSLQTISLECLFRMMNEYVITHHQFAPFCYKALIFSLIENHSNEFAREYIMSHMITVIQSNPEIPVHVMIDPLVKQYASTCYVKTDFEFFSVLCNHPKLPLKQAMLLMHLLGKVALNDLQFGRLASISFLSLANRFLNESSIEDYIAKYTKVALSIFLNSTQQMHACTTSSSSQTILSSPGSSLSDESGHPDPNYAKCVLSVEMIAKLCHLRCHRISARMFPSISAAAEHYQSLYHRAHSGLQSLLLYLQNEPTIDSVPRSDVALQKPTHSVSPIRSLPPALPSIRPLHKDASPNFDVLRPTPPFSRPYDAISTAPVSSSIRSRANMLLSPAESTSPAISLGTASPAKHTKPINDCDFKDDSNEENETQMILQPVEQTHVKQKKKTARTKTLKGSESAEKMKDPSSSNHSEHITPSGLSPSDREMQTLPPKLHAPYVPALQPESKVLQQIEDVKRKRAERLEKRQQAEQQAKAREEKIRQQLLEARAAASKQRLQKSPQLQVNTKLTPLNASSQPGSKISSPTLVNRVIRSNSHDDISRSVLNANQRKSSFTHEHLPSLAPRFPSILPPLSPAVQALLMKRFRHALQTIFKTYCGKRPSAAKPSSFDSLVHQLSLSDFVLLFQDLELLPQFISKLDSVTIYHAYQTAQGFTFERFCLALWHISQHIGSGILQRCVEPAPQEETFTSTLPEEDRPIYSDVLTFIHYIRCKTLAKKIGPEALWNKAKPKRKKGERKQAILVKAVSDELSEADEIEEMSDGQQVAFSVLDQILSTALGIQLNFPKSKNRKDISKTLSSPAHSVELVSDEAGHQTRQAIIDARRKRDEERIQKLKEMKELEEANKRKEQLKHRQYLEEQRKQLAAHKAAQAEAKKKADEEKEAAEEERRRQIKDAVQEEHKRRMAEKARLAEFKAKRDAEQAELVALKQRLAEQEAQERKKQVELYLKKKQQQENLKLQEEQRRQEFLAKIAEKESEQENKSESGIVAQLNPSQPESSSIDPSPFPSNSHESQETAPSFHEEPPKRETNSNEQADSTADRDQHETLSPAADAAAPPVAADDDAAPPAAAADDLNLSDQATLLEK